MSAILRKQGIDTKDFNAQELNYLLSYFKSNFEGRDVFVVADIVNKLTQKLNLMKLEINEVQILNQAMSNSTIEGLTQKQFL